MSILRTVWLYGLLILLLWGCAVDKRPDQYTTAINVSSSLSAHASRLNQHSELQQALKLRNLTVTATGEILPINQSVCNAALYYRLTQAQLPQYIGRHQDLLAGFYIDVALLQQRWSVVDADNDFKGASKQQDFAELAANLSPRLLAGDAIIIRPAPGLTNSNISQLVTLSKSLFSGHRLQFIVPPKQLSLITRLGAQAISDSATQSHHFLASTAATSAARKRVVLKLDSFDVADAVAVVVDSQPLNACMQTNEHAILSPSQSVTAAPLRIDNVLLASVLPKDADFNRLNEQQKLMSQGQYLTFDNKQKNYQVINKVDSNRCRQLAKGDADYQYCIDRQQDGETVITTKKYIMKKQK